MDNDIDESLYSRQLYVLGHDAMKRMSNSDVLVLGLQGLGAEVAKNLVLAGVRSVTLFDPNTVKVNDLSTQFFLRKTDIGHSRAQACASRLAELNSYVSVHVLQSSDFFKDIHRFHCVILANSTMELQLQINKLTRTNNIPMISVNSFGLFGSIFCDFGNEFEIHDLNGESPITGNIATIDKQGNITLTEESRHNLENDDYVSFREIRGLESLNGQDKSFKIKVLGPYSFNIGDLSTLKGEYISGGTFQQCKFKNTISFDPLEKALLDPKFVYSDFSKTDRAIQIHVGFQAVHRFTQNNRGNLPLPRNSSDAEAVLAEAKIVASQLKNQIDLDIDLIKEISYQALGDLSPMVAVFGSLASQEALKAISGKYNPIQQFLYFDALECLPKDLTPEDCQPIGSRYDGQIAVFGRKFQMKLENSRTFVVGAGAIGCEILKNFAMMGIGCNQIGKIYLTDMDSIEKSNLNRQFLFRPNDVGQLKSKIAARKVKEMNENLLNIIDYSERVGPESEHIFHQDFFKDLDCVFNALDNVDARLYMDHRCLLFKRPLIDSGTLGTKGNTQVVYPNLTESYGSSRDPPEKSFPICTIKNFPNQIAHTIAWARDLFEGTFKQNAENVNMYLTSTNFLKKLEDSNNQKPILESIQKYLLTEKPMTFEDCIIWARKLFELQFNNNIAQLLYNFPEDSKTSTGTLFWSPPKRAPRCLVFDPNDSMHMDFIISAANLHAFNYNLRGNSDVSFFTKVLENIEIEQFKPKEGVYIKSNDEDNEPKDSIKTDQDEIDSIINSLPSPNELVGYRLVPAEFEKDDDANFHIDFITAASNLRASNYAIDPVSRYQTKLIAGKIIPAIATTTSLVTGLVCLEFYKVIDQPEDISRFKNAFVNLALPFIAFSEPIKSPQVIINNVRLDMLWDKFEIENMTLESMIQYFKENYKLTITMITYGSSLLYANFHSKEKLSKIMCMPLTEIAQLVSKKPIPKDSKFIILEVSAEDENGEDIDVPDISVTI